MLKRWQAWTPIPPRTLVWRHLVSALCRKPLNRRYIVVEGLYQGTGDLAPLAQIAALKRRYKYRLVVDESLAVGALGPTGRGAAQHCGLQPQDVDIVCSSLGELASGKLWVAEWLRAHAVLVHFQDPKSQLQMDGRHAAAVPSTAACSPRMRTSSAPS